MSIMLLIFPKCSGAVYTFPTAKLANIPEIMECQLKRGVYLALNIVIIECRTHRSWWLFAADSDSFAVIQPSVIYFFW